MANPILYMEMLTPSGARTVLKSVAAHSRMLLCPASYFPNYLLYLSESFCELTRKHDKPGTFRRRFYIFFSIFIYSRNHFFMDLGIIDQESVRGKRKKTGENNENKRRIILRGK